MPWLSQRGRLTKTFNTMKRLENKVIVITGVSMGLATAQEAARHGASPVLVDYNEQALTDAAEAIGQEDADVKVTTVTTDVSDEKAVKR